MAVDPDVRERREALVREHMESENRHDYDVTIDTFDHPRYEIVPTGDVFDGPDAVRRYFEDSRTAFPDQRNELIALHHADSGVIVEFDLLVDPPGAPAWDPAHREAVHLPHRGVLPVRGGPARLRARLLRRGDDPRPARPDPTAPIAAGRRRRG